MLEFADRRTGIFGGSNTLHGGSPVGVLNGIDTARRFGTCPTTAEGANAPLLGDIFGAVWGCQLHYEHFVGR